MNWTKIGLFMVVVGGVQCTSKTNATIEVVESPIISISCPKTAISNNLVPVTITFQGRNGCAQPYEIRADKIGQTIQLRAYSSYSNEAEFCTEVLIELKLDYSYFADLPGDYFFLNAQNNSIGDTLKVY